MDMTIRKACLEQLDAALGWGLDETRPAWQRALRATSGSPPRYRRSALIEVRAAVVAQSRPALAEWLEGASEGATTAQLEDLATTPADALWMDLVCMNRGIFGANGDPLLVFRAYVPSTRPIDNPLYLSPCPDGFGPRRKP